MKGVRQSSSHEVARKIQAHGMGGKLLIWIEKWLTGRQQRVVIKGQQSG